MNRNELIDYIRDPASLTSDHLNQLEEIVAEAPYFQSARLLLAKGSAILNEPATKKRVTSAAIYATDRPLLKKYISGNLLFLTKPPSQKGEEPAGKSKASESTKSAAPSAKTKAEKDGSALTTVAPTDDKLFIPGIPVGALDAILDELEQDIEDLKFSRSKFADLQEQLEDEGDISTTVEESAGQEASETLSETVETPEAPMEEIAKEEMSETSFESQTADLPTATSEDDTTEDSELLENQNDKTVESEKENEVIDPPAKVEDKAAPIDESIPVEEKSTASDDAEEEDEIEKAITEKLKNLQKQESTKIEEVEKEELPKAIEPETELPPGVDQIREVKLESDIRREQRMEKRLEREKRLSSLNKLSETSIKKLEDQMWGDSDDDTSKKTEKGKPAKTEDKLTLDKEDSKKSDEPIEKSTPETKITKKSPAKKAPEETSSTKNTKETPVKKVAEKKTTVKKTEAKPTKTKKATAKKATTKKAATKAPTSKKSTTPKKPSAAKAATTRKTSTKGTTKKSATKKASPKKKSEDDGKSDRPKKQDKLIEKFISENPSISKGIKKPKSDDDLSTKSATWNKELASEYLAEIYLNQGNKKRAIEIYKVLSLKFPQKKSYFADLISKIK
ncbi:MAG: hypothetical protein ABJP45_08840 [Cyclobacteriaceae bacterium]